MHGEACPGEQLTDQHSFNLYCAGRPFVVMAHETRPFEREGLPCSPEVPVATLLDIDTGTITLGELLGHRAGLGTPDALTFLSSPTRTRTRLLPTLREAWN